MSPRLRFAPSPTGRVHLGHAYSALLNESVARELGGTFLLRIDDIDRGRARPEFVSAMLDDLRWLGLRWPEPVRRQSEHGSDYRAAAGVLRNGGLLYRCVCTRGEIADAVALREQETGRPWPRDPDGAPLYPGTCRLHPPPDDGRPVAWRLDGVAARARHPRVTWRAFDPGSTESRTVEARPERWGDAVLVRKDAPASYNLAVVVDDAAQAITHVVRGADLEAATDLHALVAAALGLELPRLHHHRLLLDEDGRKLAKSRGSVSLAALREAGATPAALRAELGLPP